MKIGIEAQRIFRKKKHGMDMVALELIRNLQEVDKVNEYVIFVSPDEDNTVIKETPNFKIVELGKASYPVWEQVLLPRAARKYGCDLLHCTSNTAPLLGKTPLMITLHDIIYMESSLPALLMGKGTNYQKFGNAYRRLLVPRIMKKARKIITVSGFEKECIADFFKMKMDNRLDTVYNGVSEHFKPVANSAERARIKAKYHLPDEFFFFLGNTHPKKNTPGTLKAFADYIKETGSAVQLVMIDYDRSELEKILQEIGAPELIDRIVLTGYVDNRDLPGIYSQCRLFLYPSLRESFGIPIIEAMACGAPVITSNTSSMPEVAGGAAVLVDPYNPAEITAAIKKVLDNPALKESMISDGIRQAARFSWKAMAEQVLHMYREMYQTSGHPAN